MDEWHPAGGVGIMATDAADVRTTGMTWDRRFAGDGHPFDDITWETRPVSIRDASGAVVFADDFEAPSSWGDDARTIVASKYCYGKPDMPSRERSARDVVNRVARKVADWGFAQGYFATVTDANNYRLDLTWLLIHQHMSFNSPVWFNVGHDLYPDRVPPPADNWRCHRPPDGRGWFDAVRNHDIFKHPQVHACFIQPVDDSIAGIMELATAEAMVFKYGSGSGTDLSPIRSTRERVSGGGRPSGPVSFMRIYDAVGGTIKSGGKTRRAAKMQILRCDHPDIHEFVRAKWKEERKARALVAAGYSGGMDGEAYRTVAFQNCNMSVRCTDDFMDRAADAEGRPFPLLSVTTGEVVDRVDARELLREIARCAWECGDPAVQFDDRFQEWHTTPNAGRINATNPCGEFAHIDNSACNLASIRLTAFVGDGDRFEFDRFADAVEVAIVAMDVLIGPASYPTAALAIGSNRFRQLGLGYADLGAFLMRRGIAYDSALGRAWCGAISALMTGLAYSQSAKLARDLGPFDAYYDDEENMRRVMVGHREALVDLRARLVADVDFYVGDEVSHVVAVAMSAWDSALELGGRHGYRNAQATLIAPTGTIAFMMGCDTTGIEPETALVRYKALAGGGTMKIVNRSVRPSLSNLGYDGCDIDKIVGHVEEYDTIEDVTIEGATIFNVEFGPDDLPVFDCALPPARGLHRRSISADGHLGMMAAAQPFLSGAISKTINLPSTASPEDVFDIYIKAWKLGLKSVTVYRDGCKGGQPITTAPAGADATANRGSNGKVLDSNGITPVVVGVRTPDFGAASPSGPVRRRLPDTRGSVTHHFEIHSPVGMFDFYLTVGLYEDGTPGEVFIKSASKSGSTLVGILDAMGVLISLALQHGVPLDVLCRKFAHAGFEPSGPTRNRDMPMAKSIVDYVFRWLASHYSDVHCSDAATDDAPLPVISGGPQAASGPTGMACPDCGSPSMEREGSTCWRCMACFYVSGGCGG